jgi:hypothetical protein
MTGGLVFERFTDRSRKVMHLARGEALHLGHSWVGTQHLLMGLLREGSGVGANVLRNMGLTLSEIRRELRDLIAETPGPEGGLSEKGSTPWTERSWCVFELAQEEARGLNHNYVGTEHLLLGLLAEGEGIAAQVLANMKLSPADVREEVMSLLGCGFAAAEGFVHEGKIVPPTKGVPTMPENAPQNAPEAQESTPTPQAAPHSAGAAPFPQEAVKAVADFLRGKSSDRLGTVRAVNTLLGWALDLFAPAEQPLTAGAAPAGKDGEELARSLEGLALAHGGAYPTAGAALTLPPWLLPLLAEVLQRALEQ